MKILFFVKDNPIPINNGVTVVTANLIRELYLDNEVFVYNYDSKKLYKISERDVLSEVSIKFEDLNFDFVVCSPLWGALKLKFLNKNIRYNKIFTLANDCYTYVLLRHGIVSIKVNRFDISDLKGFLKILPVYLVESLVLFISDRILVQSKTESRVYGNYFLFGDKSLVIPNATQFSIDKNELDKYERSGVGLVASFNDVYIKVTKWFISEVWISVIEKDPTQKLYVLGKNAEKVLLYVKEFYPHITDSIIIEDYHEKIEEFYLKRTVVVSPIFKNLGLINKTIEAMHCGCTVIGDKGAFNGLDEFVSGTHGVIIHNKQEFSNSIVNEVLTLKPSYGIAAHEYIKNNLSWKKNAHKIIETYKTMEK